MPVKNGIKTILQAADAGLYNHTKAAPREQVTDYKLIKAETETKERETPRTKGKGEPTGTTPEYSQKRLPTTEPAAPWQSLMEETETETEDRTENKNGRDKRESPDRMKQTGF